MVPFTPHKLPLKKIAWESFIDLMGQANRSIAHYDGLLQSVPNPDVLLSPLGTQEAVLSSKIEGTQATLEEVMEFEADHIKQESNRGDIYEIINYRLALSEGRDKMKEIPLSLRVIREMHKILLTGVRGETKDPGNFRKIQNHIGPPGSTMENARFVPPTVQVMKGALDEWEKYIHFDEKDILVQLAIVHAQFEIIHPFLDGNGRIGRILIPLFLYHKGIIQEPVFYLSDYLESNRSEYYDGLKYITDTNDWTNWIRFFLKAIIYQSKKNIEKTKQIIELYEKLKTEITKKTHSQFAIHCLDFLFIKPIFRTPDFRSKAGIPKSSVSRLLKTLVDTNIIMVVIEGSGSRPTLFAFRDLIDIINK